MKVALKNTSIILILVLALCLCAFSFVACNKKNGDATPIVNYRANNNFEISVENYTINPEAAQNEQLYARVFKPLNGIPKYGLVFFVGTFISPNNYDYLGEALARQGYVVIIPNSILAYWQYDTKSLPITTNTQQLFSDVQFFVGGHSQGGGAALRFACENMANTLGAVFFAPLMQYNTRSVSDDDTHSYDNYAGQIDRDESGKIIAVSDTLVNTNLPALLLEADNDSVLDDGMKADSHDRMPKNVQNFVLQNASHMGFSKPPEGVVELTEDEVAQIENTINYTLSFMQMVVCG